VSLSRLARFDVVSTIVSSSCFASFGAAFFCVLQVLRFALALSSPNKTDNPPNAL
jgi:hypothetical protein